MRAFEVPVRKNSDMMMGDLAMVPVQPFIEISFKNYTSRTTTAEGSNPTWNQELQLTVRFVIFFFLYFITITIKYNELYYV